MAAKMMAMRAMKRPATRYSPLASAPAVMSSSPMNMAKGGDPAMAAPPRTSREAVAGMVLPTPLISRISLVRYLCMTLPAPKNIRVLVREWATTWKRAPSTASGPPIPKPRAMIPMCSTLENARNRLRSLEVRRKAVAMATDSSPKNVSREEEKPGTAAWARMCTLSTPYMAQLSRTAERRALMGVGDWLWASGSQVCIGARPAFVPRPTTMKMKATFTRAGSSWSATARSADQSRVSAPSPSAAIEEA